MLNDFLKQIENQIYQDKLTNLDTTNITYPFSGGDCEWIYPIAVLSENNHVLTLNSHAVIQQWDVNTETCSEMPWAADVKDYRVHNRSIIANGNILLNYRLAYYCDRKNSTSDDAEDPENNIILIVSGINGKILSRIDGYYHYQSPDGRTLQIHRKARFPDGELYDGNTRYRLEDADSIILSSDGTKKLGSSFYDHPKKQSYVAFSKQYHSLCDNGNAIFIDESYQVTCSSRGKCKSDGLVNLSITIGDKATSLEKFKRENKNFKITHLSNGNLCVQYSLAVGANENQGMITFFNQDGEVLGHSKDPRNENDGYHSKDKYRSAKIKYIHGAMISHEIVVLSNGYTAVIYAYEDNFEHDIKRYLKFEIFDNSKSDKPIISEVKEIKNDGRGIIDGTIEMLAQVCSLHKVDAKIIDVDTPKILQPLLPPQNKDNKFALSDGRIISAKEKENMLVLHDTTAHLRIQTTDLVLIFQALENNYSVTACNLSNLPLGDKGIAALTDMLRKNHGITTLILQNNNITDIGAKLLLTVLQSNQKIVAADLSGNKISVNFLAQINAQLAKNTRQIKEKAAFAAVKSSVTPPEDFTISDECRCSITHLVMVDPVITADGETYERETIEKWLKDHDTSPRSNEKLEHKFLTSNKTMMRTLASLHEKYPTLLTSSEIYFPLSRRAQCLAAVSKNDSKELARLIDLDRRLLIDEFSDAAGKNQTLLFFAVCNGTQELLEMVLNKLKPEEFQKLIAATGDNGISLFKQAVKHQKIANAKCIGKALGWNQADYSEQLFVAIKNHDTQMVMACSELDAPLDTVDANGNTPLHAAIDVDDKSLLKLFLERGANLHMRNTSDQTIGKYAEHLGKTQLASDIRAMKQDASLRFYQEKIATLEQQLEERRHSLSVSSAPTSSSSSTIMTSHTEEYTPEEVFLLLNHYVGKYDVKICEPLSLYKKASQGMFVDMFDNKQLLEIIADSSKEKDFILPMNFPNQTKFTGQHWVALYFHFNLDDLAHPIIGYFNPIGDNHLPLAIEKVIVSTFPEFDSKKHLIISPIALQDDNCNSSGPWMVAILEHLVISKGSALPDENFDIDARRKNDVAILHLLDSNESKEHTITFTPT